MIKINKPFEIYSKIFALLEKKHKSKFFYLFFLMMLSMIFEIFTLGMLLPILNIVTNINIETISYIPNFLLNNTKSDLIKIFLILFVFIYFIKISLITLMTWYQIGFYENISVHMSKKLFIKYLNQDYVFHLNRNSSELIRNISGNINEFSYFGIFSILILLSESLIILGMIFFLITFQTVQTLFIGTILLISFVIFHKLLSPRSSKLGSTSQYHDRFYQQHLYQGLQSIKEIKILGRQDTFVNNFYYHVSAKAKINRIINFIQFLPRIFIELLLIIFISLLIFYLSLTRENFISLLPTIGIYAAVAIRLIPSISKIMAALQKLKYSIPKIENLYNEFKIENNENNHYKNNYEDIFRQKINIKDLFFKYNEKSIPVLKNINFIIDKNKKIGIIGQSGAGKSTLVDILLGLLQPTQGEILIDDKKLNNNLKNWQRNIGYVSQNIILTDDSLKRNIAFGLSDESIINKDITRALKQANLFDFVNDLPEGLDTLVGEFGSKLSGGQLQRIGIARALYHNPPILFLDEATSALDMETEKNIINTVMSLNDKTVIIISHKLNSIKDCDEIIEIKNGNLIKINKNKVKDQF